MRAVLTLGPRYVFPTDERDDNAYNGGEQMAEIPLLDNFYTRIQFSYDFLKYIHLYHIYLCSYLFETNVSNVTRVYIRLLPFITNIINPGNISIP